MLNPCGHRVIVKRDATEEVSAGGIVIASSESAKKLEKANCQTGVVVAVGPDAWKAFRMLDDNGNQHNGRPWAEVGDYVLYSKYSGRNIDDPYSDEEDLMIMLDEDILAVITEEPQYIPEAKEA